MEKLITVLVVDDHAVVRRGLRSLLTSKYQIEVIGEASDGVEAIDRARELQPDVILMDMLMPRKNGLEAIAEIKRETPGSHIIVLTSYSEDIQIVAAIKAGAAGYVLKDASPDELVHTIHSAYLGKLTLSADMFQLVISASNGASSKRALNASLTEREVDVLRELARGGSNQQIADALSVSTATVRTHISNILSKLELENRTQAALYANEVGLLSAGR
jgi:DNA-binding NarL/FixJ family response regulator